MNIRMYQNEAIVVGALLLMLIGYGYKNTQMNAAQMAVAKSTVTLQTLKEGIALKKIWADGSITKKLNRVKKSIPVAKTSWQKRGKKLKASFGNLSDKELNTLVNKLLNIPVVIKNFEIEKKEGGYDMEFQCQW